MPLEEAVGSGHGPLSAHQILNPRLFMHFLCDSTNSLHLQPSSPSSSVCPNFKKQSSLAIFVSGHAQHGLIPCGLSSETNLFEVSTGFVSFCDGGGEGVDEGDGPDDEDDDEDEELT